MAFLPPKKAYTYFYRELDIVESSQDWWVFECVVCNDIKSRKKMAVHFGYGIVKCWICGYKESILDFIAGYENITYQKARTLVKSMPDSDIQFSEMAKRSPIVTLSETTLPHGYTSILDGEGILGIRARNYLTGRGFDLVALDRMGIGYCPVAPPEDSEEVDYLGYIIIPFKIKGKLVYYIGRDYIGNFLRYKNPDKLKISVGKGDLLFNEDALSLYDEVYLFEGWADAVTLGTNSVATQGWTLSAIQKYKIINSACKLITIVPDAGFDGQGVSFYLRGLELAMELVTHKEVRVIDLNGHSGKDVNEMGLPAFTAIAEGVEIMNEQDIMMKFLYYE